MSRLSVSFFIFIVFLTASCNNTHETKQEIAVVQGNDIEVYYFHMTSRCITCRTVEAEARKNVEVLFPELYNSGKISFISLNLEEDGGKTLGDRLGVKGQTLLIVKGDQKINITNEGFLYAVSRPDKFSEVMKEKVNQLMD